MSNMLKILQGFDAVEKKTITESAIAECGMTETPAQAPVSINITGDVSSMAAMLKMMGGANSGTELLAPVAGSFQDDPEIPGRDDIEGDTDLNAGIIGTTIGAGLGGAAGMALGGPMGALTGGLAGASAGDQLTDEPFDDPAIPGRDDVEGDTDLNAGVIDSLAGFAGDAIAKGGELGANLASKAASAVADTDVGMGAIRKLAGVSNLVPDALVKTGAQAAASNAGSKIGQGAVKFGAPAAALGAVSALGNNGDEIEQESEEYNASTEPDEKYADQEMMSQMSGGINGKKKMYKPAAKGDNPMATEMKSRLMAALAEKKAKPDFLDVDKDGDKKEPMKKAIADKKKTGPVKEAVTESADIARMKQFLTRLNG